MPVKSGREYIERINNNPPDVWITGEQVNGSISEHKALKRDLWLTSFDVRHAACRRIESNNGIILVLDRRSGRFILQAAENKERSCAAQANDASMG